MTDVTVTGWPPAAPVPWPDVATYKVWARLADDVDDESVTQAMASATAAVRARCTRIPADADPELCPPEVALAILLWANRLVARRNSPTGIVGIDETGQATLAPSRDPDIARLLSPWTEPVMA